MTSSQTKIEAMEENLLASSKMLEKSISAAANAELVASNLQTKLQAFEEDSKDLSTAL